MDKEYEDVLISDLDAATQKKLEPIFNRQREIEREVRKVGEEVQRLSDGLPAPINRKARREIARAESRVSKLNVKFDELKLELEKTKEKTISILEGGT